MIDYFNAQVDAFQQAVADGDAVGSRGGAAAFVDRNETRYSWTRGDFKQVSEARKKKFSTAAIRPSLYRPFFKQHLAFGSDYNEYPSSIPALFPRPDASNLGISVVTSGSKAPFGVTATDAIPCMHLIGSDITTFLARWQYEKPDQVDSLFGAETDWKRVSNLKPEAVHRFQVALGSDITDDDVFHYVYGALHSPEFRERYESNLKKEAPRVPMPPDRATFDAYRDAGAELMELHIGYETIEPYPSKNTGPPAPTLGSTQRCSASATRRCATPRSPTPKLATRSPTAPS
jgi:predicted helicase